MQQRAGTRVLLPWWRRYDMLNSCTARLLMNRQLFRKPIINISYDLWRHRIVDIRRPEILGENKFWGNKFWGKKMLGANKFGGKILFKPYFWDKNFGEK